MLKQGVIQHSSSQFASPILLLQMGVGGFALITTTSTPSN
jgi:hypothetical protein